MMVVFVSGILECRVWIVVFSVVGERLNGVGEEMLVSLVGFSMFMLIWI